MKMNHKTPNDRVKNPERPHRPNMIQSMEELTLEGMEAIVGGRRDTTWPS